MKKFAGIAGLLFLAGTVVQAADEPWVVHEWGTFTSLQDEQGNAIGGINTDDEPVPEFVHRLSDWLLLRPGEAPPTFFQGAPRCHPDVTMRLETPVLYFHAPDAASLPAQVQVEVAFRGGWLTEYYPDARAEAPGVARDSTKFGPLTAQTTGSIRWDDLSVGGEWQGPQTNSRVWLTPRMVKSASVRTGSGESEQYLFYRGVGHVPAPLKVTTEDGALRIHTDQSGQPLWLVEIGPQERCAYRALAPLPLQGGSEWRPKPFETADFSTANLERLRASMKEQLIAQGLFPDEAEAMLKTWELSYFKSPGLRLFYIVSAEWVNAVLPLRVSPPATITRVMIGRIEIVTPEQRSLLRAIARGPAPEISSIRAKLPKDYYDSPQNVSLWNDIMAGKAPLAKLGPEIPELYAAYLKLGRFRNALVLDEQAHRPTEALARFISLNGLDAYQIER